MRRLCIVLALLCMVVAAQPQSADEYYVRIYNVIQEADTLSNNLQFGAALEKYRQARLDLERFQKGNPGWNANIMRFRIAYLNERIAQLEQKVQPAPRLQPQQPSQPQAPGAGGPATDAALAALQAQVGSLQEQIQSLQTDRDKLQAQLREALGVRPAAVDPRELQKAEERLQALQKENDLLKVNIEQLKNQPPQSSPADRAALSEMEKKLSEQMDKVRILELEKRTLQDRLTALEANAAAGNKEALDKANQSLAERQERINKLDAERLALEARVKALETDSQTAGALKAENELLKKQLAEAQAKNASLQTAPSATATLEAQLAALTSEKDMLLLEKKALQNRVATLQAEAAAPAPLPAPAAPPVVTLAPAPAESSAPAPAIAEPPPTRSEARRIRELEKERDSLTRKLAAAQRELKDVKAGSRASRLRQLQNELTSVKSRLQALEAQKIPYSPEELALFRAPEPVFAEPSPASPPPRKFSASTAGMAAQAKRDFAAGRLDQAESGFEQVLQQDNTDVVTLANLATVQISRREYDKAEANLKRALEIAPDDAFTMAALGRLRFLQGRHDDAFDALSRAATLDPKSAEIQNYLGLVLSEKGLRGPAEAALRKAVQLQPGYGTAHQNLAVVYLNQNPPLVELARFHYNKSLAAGEPRNEQLEKLLESKQPKR